MSVFTWPWSAPVFGLILWLGVCFQLASGLRWIKLPRKYRTKIHKWVGIGLVVLGPLHGLWATAYFLGWPFPLG